MQSVGKGILSSIVLFFVPYGAFKNASIAANSEYVDLTNSQALGFVVSTTLILSVSLQVRKSTENYNQMQGQKRN